MLKKIKQIHSFVIGAVKLLCLFILLAGTFSNSYLSATPKTNIKKAYKQLAPRYQRWYDFVTYIISEMETRIFFQLENDRERDSFIKLFWNTKHNEHMVSQYDWLVANAILLQEIYEFIKSLATQESDE